MTIFRDILETLGLVKPEPDPAAFAPRVVVKVLDNIAVNLGQGESMSLSDLAARAGAPLSDPQVAAIADPLGNNTLRRVFDSVGVSDLQRLVAGAKDQDAAYAPPEFDNFLEVACPLGFDTDSLATAFAQWVNVVEYSYTAPEPSDPAVAPAMITGTGNPLFAQQQYLATAPAGIDAPAAWSKGATGASVSFFDLEQGWFLGHEDLPVGIATFGGNNMGPAPAGGFGSVNSFAHGAAVLGELIAIDNTTGIVGIAPDSRASVISYWDRTAPTSANPTARIADRIVSAAAGLMFGDVLLLEAQLVSTVPGQGSRLPVETDVAVFEAIRLATKFGVIVVEAAGNGRGDLDLFTDAKNKNVLSRGSADFKDSGAIMVGACVSGVPHSQWDDWVRSRQATNYGTRIDCYAWGENIVTCGWRISTPTANNVYWGVAGAPAFGGTSGASPIIAGCCLLLQDLQTKLTPKSGSGNLSPAQMRQVLSDPQNGTASFEVTDQIGSMPDFAKIIANEFV